MDQPITVGVFRVTRIRAAGPSITKTFGEPRADLLAVDFDALSDEEIANLK
jgi:hypothetical protein